MIGNYYCFDNPEALSEQLKKEFADTKYGEKWQSWFALFYSVYSFPNVILPFFGGYLVDKLGVIKMLVIFNIFLLGGQCVFAIGGNLKSIPIMLAGRVIFGFGGENLTVAQSALMAAWFKNKELAFALGVCLSLSRLGSVANNFLSPLLWEHHKMALWGGAMICGGSLACTLALAPVEKMAERKLKKLNPAAASIQVEDENIKMTDVKYFTAPFWLLTFSCIITYGTVIPFNSIASSFFQHRDFLNTVTQDPCENWKLGCQGPWTAEQGVTNRTYVVPSDCNAIPALAKDANATGCDPADVAHLGLAYVHAVFGAPGVVSFHDDSFGPQYNAGSDVGNGTKVTAHCSVGFQQVQGAPPIQAVCTRMKTCDGNTTKPNPPAIQCGYKWELTKESNASTYQGCYPTSGKCDSSDAAQLGILNVASSKDLPTAAGVSKTLQCKQEGSNSTQPLGWCATNGTGCNPNVNTVGVTCNAHGLYEWEGAAYCDTVLFEPHKYCNQFNDAISEAAKMVSIPYLISACISPFLGIFIDRYGMRAVMATLSPMMLMLVHLLLALTSIKPLLPMVLQGVSYSVFAAALWPSVPYCVDERYVGTAYGLLTAVQNGGLALFPVIIGQLLNLCNFDPPTTVEHILDNATHAQCSSGWDNYKHSEFFFAGLAGLGLLIGIWLNIDDKTKRNSQLNKVHGRDDAEKTSIQ